MSKTSALANSVPTSSAVQAASASLASRCQMRRQNAIRPRSRGGLGSPPGRPPGRSRRVPRPWAIPGRPPPRPSRAGIASVDQVAGRDPAGDEVVADRDEELRLVSVEAERDDARPERAADVSGGRLERVHRGVRERRGDEADPRRDLVGTCRQLARLGQPGSGAGLEPAPGLAQLVLEGRDPVADPIDSSCAPSASAAASSASNRCRTSASAAAPVTASMPAHPGADAPLAGDQEAADLAGRQAVGAAAQLEAVALDPDGPDRLAVLLVEEGIGAALDRLGHAHERDGDGPVLADDAVDLVLDRTQLVAGQRPVEREVEAQVVRGDQRARLARPLPDHVPQRAVEQVRARVVAHRVGPPLRVDDRLDGLADPQPAVERAALDDQAAERLLRVGHGEQLAPAARLAQHAVVADLAAALGVERRPVEDDLRLAVAGQLVELHPVAHDGEDAALGGRRLVAHEPRVADPAVDRAVERGQLGVLRELRLGPRAAAVALLGKSALEPVAIDRDAVLGGELDGQVDREAIRVVKLEGDLAVESWHVRRQVLGRAADDARRGRVLDDPADLGLEQPRPGVERPGELRLLAGDDAEDLVAPRDEVWVRLAHDVDDDARGLGHERLAPAEQPAVADRAAEELAQDVAAALVRGQDVVADEERHRPRVVGDDLVAEPLGLERVGVVAHQLAHPGVDRREQVGVVVGRDLLEDARQALEAHPGVDAGERQRDPPVGPLVELHEHEVPDLEPARAVLAVVGDALGAFGELDPAVEMDLAARPARAGVGHPPEVVVVAVVDVAPARHPLGRQADLVAPDVPGDLVVGVGRGRQPVGRDAEVAGQEVPGEVDRLALEVVAERPVAEHLEEGVVARRPADLLEVVVLAGDPQAALVVDGPRVGPRLGADQHVLELDHPGVREQERRVAGRDEAGAGHGRRGRARRRTRRTGGGSRRRATPRSADRGLDGWRHRTQWYSTHRVRRP